MVSAQSIGCIGSFARYPWPPVHRRKFSDYGLFRGDNAKQLKMCQRIY